MGYEQVCGKPWFKVRMLSVLVVFGEIDTFMLIYYGFRWD